MGKSQRTTFNFIKSAGLSKGYYLHVFVGGIAFVGIMLAYASSLLGEINLVVANIPDTEVSDFLLQRLMMVAVLYFLSFLAFLVSTVFYLIIVGQRVGGPVVAICAYIEELKKGNYQATRTLRKNDELVPIMMSLHELAETLSERKNKAN